MEILDRSEGTLKVLVANEGVTIYVGTPVVVETIVDNFKNLAVRVRSASKTVLLNFYNTDTKWLLGR